LNRHRLHDPDELAGSVRNRAFWLTDELVALCRSSGCQDVENNCRLAHELPTPRRGGNVLAHSGPKAKEVAQFIVAPALACR
jgi:hypothetical protein